MDKITQIKEPFRKEFETYERYMRDMLESGNEFVESIIDYVVSGRGKGIRPLLVFIMAGLHSKTGEVARRAYLAAMLVEMVHTASLVHDDVIDDSQTRHGKASVNSKWNSRIAVLTGDYILARSFSSGMSSAQFDLVSYITKGISELVEGELIQIDVNNRRDMKRESYFDIIFKKTATLLGISCGSGAMASGADAGAVAKACEIGVNLGMAFQIKDDILDYAPEEQTGKSSCADLREKKVTLPLLTIIEKCDEATRAMIAEKINGIDENPANIDFIRDFVISEGGIEAAMKVMDEYLGKAYALIASYPESHCKTSLTELCGYIGERDK